MYQKTENVETVKKEDAKKFFEDDLHSDLLEIEPSTLLDKSLFGFFEKCFFINQVISKYEFFLRFFERRNMYRFLIKKRGKRKKMKLQEICRLGSSKNLMVM